MNSPVVEFDFNRTKSEGLTNSVLIIFDAKSVDILENPTTGERISTGRSTPVSSSRPINFSLRSLSQDHILLHICNQRSTIPPWLCIRLAAEIEREAETSGFGRNGFHLKIDVKITYETVVGMYDPQTSNNEASKTLSRLRIILIGTIDKEELKSLKMETEPCSICFENLSGSKSDSRATRMACSHVFHDRCLLKWLERKNTCPLCRTVLYD